MAATASAGIGTETARVLAAAGARVIMTSRDIEAGQQVAKQLMQHQLKVLTHSLVSCSLARSLAHSLPPSRTHSLLHPPPDPPVQGLGYTQLVLIRLALPSTCVAKLEPRFGLCHIVAGHSSGLNVSFSPLFHFSTTMLRGIAANSAPEAQQVYV